MTWTPDQFWEFVEGYTGAFEAGQIREILQGEGLAVVSLQGSVVVPVEPTPAMLGAWYQYKSGWHPKGTPAPTDTSDYGAYRAMLAAAPSVSRHDGKDEAS
jgi:hypothetical protein